MMQMGFLVLIFAAAIALVYGISQFVGGSAIDGRVKRLFGVQAAKVSNHWVERVARATKPLAQLSKPEEGFENSALQRKFFNAGIRSSSAAPAYFGVKTALALALPLLVFATLTLWHGTLGMNARLFFLLAMAGVGYYLPNVVLSRLVFYRQREVFENFPDALDLMTVCMEAGLGTEAAMNRVAEDMVHKSNVLSDELRLVNLELRAGAPRDRALRNLALRTGVPEVDGFVSMIIQAERFGTSIADALRVHADMLRVRRRQKAEEAAAKIALKLLFPLIFTIFPSLLLALMGPAMIQIYRILLPSMGGGH